MKPFYDVKTNQKSEKTDKLSHIGGWRICIMLNINFTQIFRKKYIDISSESTGFYLSTLNYKYISIVILIRKWDIRMADTFGFMK